MRGHTFSARHRDDLMMHRFVTRSLLLALLTCAEAMAADATPEWRYTVRPGDTLIGFSQQYLAHPAEWMQLQKLNHIANPRRLIPGQPLRVPIKLLRQRPAPAEVLAISGNVQLSQNNSPIRALQFGEKLEAGSSLKTATDSSATLRFADGSIVVVQPNSNLQLDTVSVYEGGGMVDTRLRLQQGRIEVGANPRHAPDNRLEVTTPSAVAAVRGTRFRVAAGPAVSLEETLEGRVGLIAAEQETGIPGGYGSIVESGKLPLAPVALLAAPGVQGLPNKVERLPMRFDLPPQNGAAGWIGQIAPDERFDRVLLEKTGNVPRLSFADLPDGRYVLRVRAIDALGLQGADALHAFELNARPFPPLVLTPGSHATVRSAQPELQWSEAAGIQTYRIQLARDTAFNDKIIDTTTSQTHLTPSQALEPGDYHLRVASIDGDDEGPFSDTISFTYKPAPGSPDLTQSALSFDGQTMRVQLPPPGEGLQYEVELASDPSRNPLRWRGESADGQLQIPRPPAGKQYLAVRLTEADGTAGPYATQVIDVPGKAHWEFMLLLLPLLAI